jgi:hypothetical protein
LCVLQENTHPFSKELFFCQAKVIELLKIFEIRSNNLLTNTDR